MTDYKYSLNLPETNFPMKANLTQKEPQMCKQWEENKLYEAIRKSHQHKPEFILHDGPIYANGHLHIGHAVNRILKDIVVKSKNLDGFNAPFVPGWDCHGLPIELNVEKKFGKAGEKLNPKEFRAKCREYASQQVDIQRDAFKRMGVLGDWEHPYLTMDYSFEADIVRALSIIAQNNHLQQGFKPVHWCTECRSALAEAEVEYQDKTSPAIDVKFLVVSPNDFPGMGELFLPIWTTTPWTLPANEAVALNEEHRYVIVQSEQPKMRLILVKELVDSVLERYKLSKENTQILEEYPAQAFKDLLLQHPLYLEKTVPVVYGEHVSLEAGTGAVHTAPSHGLEDYIVGQQYHLPVNNPVDERGCFKSDTKLFAGEFVFKANDHVIQMLKDNDCLLAEEKLNHSYPHCWRHKTPIIFRATPQWFISMDKNHLRKNALKAIHETTWMPDWGQSRIESMIKNRPDWCVSRQRQWCTPMGLIVDKETKSLHPNMLELTKIIVQKIEKNGIDAWYDLSLNELLGNDKDAEKYEKVMDTLDVWFDSGVTHFGILKGKIADLYLEGSDQHRGWFHSALLTSVGMSGKAPYKAVLTHGFAVDENGRKMSKSLGNIIAPEKVINQLGADILRLWVASTDYRAEMIVSDEVLSRTSEGYRRIRNTARFLLANLHDFDPDRDLVPFEKLLSLDQWIVQYAKTLQDEIRQAYTDYDFHLVCQKLLNFCIVELGGFYLDIIKDRQYTMQKNSLGRRSAQTAIFHVIHALVRWIAPILSFTAEEIWPYIPKISSQKETSVFLLEFYEFSGMKKLHSSIKWEKIVELRNEVNKAVEIVRNENKIGSALQCKVHIRAPKDMYDDLSAINKHQELRFVWITSDATLELSENLEIEITALEDEKCARCWHRREDVGANQEHSTICLRCVDNLPEGKGEKRIYA